MTDFAATSPTLIPTCSGVQLDLAASGSEDVRVQDLAYGLSHLCRFGGQTTRFYSVAEHALLVASVVAAEHPNRPDLVEAALHHDDHKTYIGGDIVPAVRAMLGGRYAAIVDRLNQAIAASLGFDVALLTDPIVAKANELADAIEAAQLCKPPNCESTRRGGRRPSPPRSWVGGLDPDTARIEWLARANRLRTVDVNPTH